MRNVEDKLEADETNKETLWELFQKSSQEKTNQDNCSGSKEKKNALRDIWETELTWFGG